VRASSSSQAQVNIEEELVLREQSRKKGTKEGLMEEIKKRDGDCEIKLLELVCGAAMI
jgi:hypothetical protein